MEKPTFSADQLVPATTAAKSFGTVRKRAKTEPQFITDNGEVDSVVLEYKYFEQLYSRLKELEEIEEARILSERITRLENDPSSSISWRELKQD